ncbi:MAG TPA: oxygenase MpaB family protein, partial [Acidimicrobiia bacterium]|nr:oxygenase MpaB family protein [Acidimicrobiia bacterium]
MDVGLFGPDSAAWRLHADPSMLVGAMRALLVQALEPRAMAGVVQHSDYKVDPWGRLNRTVRFVLDTTYGDTRQAEAACEAVRRIHDRIHGVDPVTGRTYSAHDPDLLLWIHAVEVHSAVFSYRSYAGRLSGEDADRYVDEMVRVAELLGLPSDIAPRSMGELRDYLRGVEGLQLTPGARESMRLILSPPMPFPLRPLWVLPASAAIASL